MYLLQSQYLLPLPISPQIQMGHSVFAADMDGDGDMDILSASHNDNTIAWYENNGDAKPTD